MITGNTTNLEYAQTETISHTSPIRLIKGGADMFAAQPAKNNIQTAGNILRMPLHSRSLRVLETS